MLAYETLSKDKTKYTNWREYGHPDGAITLKVVELMMPSFLMDPTMQPMFLASVFMVMVAVVLYFTLKLKSSQYNL